MLLQRQSFISININAHADNYVIYVYSGIKDTKIKQITKLTEMNTVCVHYVKLNKCESKVISCLII